jgi:putrescine---pyruvate transaminase
LPQTQPLEASIGQKLHVEANMSSPGGPVADERVKAQPKESSEPRTPGGERTPGELRRMHKEKLWTPFIQMKTVVDSDPVVFSHGKGAYLYDVDGRKYLDAHASLWLVNVGYGCNEVVEAACTQLRKLPFFSMFMGYSNQPAIYLAAKLLDLTNPEGMGKVFYSGSGSEAVETALKIARQYWRNLGREEKHKVISRHSAYHGVTFGAMSATGIPANRQAFGPLVPGFRHIPDPNCYRNDFRDGLTDEEVSEVAADALRNAIEEERPETVAAFIAEPVQGAGGVIIPPESYLGKCREICSEYEVLFIADEVITGFGRLGSWFGSRRYNVKPDIMCFAKGLTSGYLPLGATLCSEDIYAAFLGTPEDGREFRHGNTYSGHAAATAAALANLDVVERNDLIQNARVMGDHLLTGLRSLDRHPIVGDVRGVGLLARVELVEDRATRRPFPPRAGIGRWVQQYAQEEGVIFRNVGDVITLSPPLILTREEVGRIVDVLDRAITAVVEKGL